MRLFMRERRNDTGHLDDLIDTELRRSGRVRTGASRVVRHWSISTVLRVPTDQGPVWFKAAPPVFAHEGGIARWVASARPEHGAAVLASGPGWMLSEEVSDGGRREAGPPEGPLAAAARVQRASIGQADELRALGCPDRPPTRIAADLALLADLPDLLGERRRSDLAAVLPVVTRQLVALDGDGMPLVLVHGDIQEENALWTGGSWALIDWTDAALTHPFAELARPLMHAPHAERERVTDAFAREWADVLPAETIARALRTAPVLGAAHQVGNYFRIVEAVGDVDGLGDLLREWTRRLAVAARSNPEQPED